MPLRWPFATQDQEREKAMSDIFVSLSVVAFFAICLAVGMSNYRTSYRDDDDFAEKVRDR